MDPAIAGDLQRGIPEGAFLFLELRGDGPQRGLACLHPAVIFRAGQPEIQLQRIGRLGGLAERQQARQIQAAPRPVFAGMKRDRA